MRLHPAGGEGEFFVLCLLLFGGKVLFWVWDKTLARAITKNKEQSIQFQKFGPFLIQLFIGSNTRFRMYACEGDQSFQRFSDAVFDYSLGQLVCYG